jgi:ribonuclease G
VVTRTDIAGKHPLVCAICEDQTLLEVQCIPEDAPPQILDNIYVARVSQVVKNIGAAFVDIGKGQTCFLPLSDLKAPVFVQRMSEKQPLVQGDELLVQVVKEAVKTKDPQVTTNLSLAGTYSVVTNTDCHLGVSGKLPGDVKVRLRALAEPVYDPRFGLIIRTNAAEAEEQVLLDEIQALQGRMEQLLAHAPYQRLYSLLEQAPPEYVRILQNQRLEELSLVVTDEPEVYEQLQAFAKLHPELNLQEKMNFYEDPMLDLHKLYSLQVQLDRALQKKIWLKSGANILIEHTEAMTVIDVNSSKNVKRKLPKEQHLSINLEAAAEIARQLRLRNLSGIIIIDFIDLADPSDQEKLLFAMRGFVRSDPVKTEVVDLTKLGLMELTRKKTRKPLHEQLVQRNDL